MIALSPYAITASLIISAPLWVVSVLALARARSFRAGALSVLAGIATGSVATASVLLLVLS
jgi:hypothetical protein